MPVVDVVDQEAVPAVFQVIADSRHRRWVTARGVICGGADDAINVSRAIRRCYVIYWFQTYCSCSIPWRRC